MNHVFILCDQLRADFLHAYDCGAIPTPNIDRLAAEGIVYEQAVSPTPLCVPARASMLVGQNALESGVLSNGHWLRPDREQQGIRTWAELISELGVHTATVGKMHFHPWEASEGFAERIIAEDKRWPQVEDDYHDFLARHGLRKFDGIQHPEYTSAKGAITFPYGEEMATDRFVGEAAEAFIRRQPGDRPFAVMIGFPGPHCPYDPSPESLGRVDESQLPPLRQPPANRPPAWDETLYPRFLATHQRDWHQMNYTDFPEQARLRIRKHYAALIAQIDEEVGRILSALEETGLLEETIITFTSDHGDFVGDLGMVGKELFYEPSVHIPLIVRLPNARDAGRRISTPVELSQVPATILETYRALPERWSYPPLSVVSGIADDEPQRPVFGALNIGAWVRCGNWKLTRYQFGISELFDLESDPRETTCLWSDPIHRGIRDDLERQLNHWLIESATRGHEDKILTRGTALCKSESYSRRGWQRTYPQVAALH